MEDIKPNSHRYKQTLATEPKERPKLEPVIETGKSRINKKKGFSKVAGAIISDDAKNVKSYILLDVLIPSFKKAVSDIITNGIDIILYGETGHTKRSNAGRVSYKNYNDISKDQYTRGSTRDARERDRDSRSNRGAVSLFKDVIVDTRGEAEDIVSRMSEYLDTYDVISAADMYDLANITQFPHTYNNFGWDSVALAEVIPMRDGYVIKMPPVKSLK